MKGEITLKKVQSKEALDKIKMLGDTVYLRKNIKEVTTTNEQGEQVNHFEADEVVFENNINVTQDKLSNNFEVYFNWAKEKMENKKLKKQKEKLVNKMIDKEYTLVDLKETVDQLLTNSLGV